MKSLATKLSSEYYDRSILDEKINKSNENIDLIFLRLTKFQKFHEKNETMFNELKADIQKHEGDMNREKKELQKLLSRIN